MASKSRKTVFIFILMGILLSSFCYAKTLYVGDSITITARTGPSTEYKIIGLLKTGEKVELKEDSGEWSFVRFSGDREGWVVSRYLTEQPPRSLLVEKLQAEQKTNAELISKLEEENNALKGENNVITAQLTETRKNFDELEEGAAGYLRLKEEYENTKNKVDALLSSNEQLSLENKVLKDVTKIKWFLIGAGVMSGGWVIGFIMGRSRRKKKSGLTFSLKA